MGSIKPKKKCCESKPRCTRCPLRMLAEGTLPDGYTVKHRKLVKVKGKLPAPAVSVAPGAKPRKKDKSKKDKKKHH